MACPPATMPVAHCSCPLVTHESPNEKGLEYRWTQDWMARKRLRKLQGSEVYLTDPIEKLVPWLAVKSFSRCKVYESMAGI